MTIYPLLHGFSVFRACAGERAEDARGLQLFAQRKQARCEEAFYITHGWIQLVLAYKVAASFRGREISGKRKLPVTEGLHGDASAIEGMRPEVHPVFTVLLGLRASAHSVRLLDEPDSMAGIRQSICRSQPSQSATNHHIEFHLSFPPQPRRRSMRICDNRAQKKSRYSIWAMPNGTHTIKRST